MKNILILRHAKSDYSFGVSDHERVLARRGITDCALVGEYLKQQNFKPDAVYCSDSSRTRETFKLLNQTLNWNTPTLFTRELYLASSFEIANLISSLPDEQETVLLIGHNPGMTDLYNELSLNRLDNLPTCGFVSLKSKCKWEKTSSKKWDHELFITPKMLKS